MCFDLIHSNNLLIFSCFSDFVICSIGSKGVWSEGSIAQALYRKTKSVIYVHQTLKL